MNAVAKISTEGQAPLHVTCDTSSCVITVNGKSERVSPTILIMVAMLTNAFPGTISRDRMMKKVFSGRRARKDPAMCMRQTMKRTREKLEPLGLAVRYTPNPAGSDLPGFYSLIRADFCRLPKGGARL